MHDHAQRQLQRSIHVDTLARQAYRRGQPLACVRHRNQEKLITHHQVLRCTTTTMALQSCSL